MPLKSTRFSRHFTTIVLALAVLALAAMNFYQGRVIRQQAAELRWSMEHCQGWR